MLEFSAFALNSNCDIVRGVWDREFLNRRDYHCWGLIGSDGKASRTLAGAGSLGKSPLLLTVIVTQDAAASFLLTFVSSVPGWELMLYGCLLNK